jgi:esterase/lipase superfamily enzyme
MPRIQSGTEGSEDELAEDKHLILKVCCPADNSDPYVIRTDTVDRFLSRKKEAMVFFHGYNCPLADCLGRVAQFFALGGMPPHIVPFVFSFAAGGPVSYSWVVDGFHKYSDNLCEFFTELGDVYHDIHVVGHSCGAFAFMMNWHAIEGCFAECHPGPRHRIETEATSCSAALPRLRTVTLINPDVLFCTVAKALPSMMRRVERFTSYNDRLDQALFYSGFVRNLLGARVLCPEQQPDPNYPLLIWGACVTPIIVEEASGDSMGCTRCPLLDSGKRIGKTFGCLPQTGNIIDFGSNGDQLPVHSRIDIIDCSTMQQNVHSLRHNYYMLNTQIVEDICEVIGRRLPATARSRLTRAQGNVFNFLCPPADIDEL